MRTAERRIRTTLIGRLASGEYCVLHVQTQPSESPYARAATLLVRQGQQLTGVIILLHGWVDHHRSVYSDSWPWLTCQHWIDDKDLFEGAIASRMKASQRITTQEPS